MVAGVLIAALVFSGDVSLISGLSRIISCPPAVGSAGFTVAIGLKALLLFKDIGLQGLHWLRPETIASNDASSVSVSGNARPEHVLAGIHPTGPIHPGSACGVCDSRWRKDIAAAAAW